MLRRGDQRWAKRSNSAMPTKPSYRQAAATIPLLAALLILISAGCSVNEGRITKTGDIPAGYADTTYYIDDNDEPQLAITYRDASLFREGLAVVNNDGNYGYIDDDGEMTLPDIYKSATIFRNGKAWAVRSGSAPGVINRKGETKFTLGQAIEAEIFYEGLARFTAKESGDIRYGFVTDEGETTVPAIYYGATRFSNGLASVEDMNGKWGYINTKGEAVIPATFDAAGTFDKEGYAIVRTDNKYGIIDKNGKCLTDDFTSYGVPMVDEVPPLFISDFVDVSDDYGPFGAKSISEIATNGAAPAIAMAIADACGAHVRSWPITPEKILRALGKI